MTAVCQCRAAGRIGTDVVTGNRVSCRRSILQANAAQATSDNIAVGNSGSTNGNAGVPIKVHHVRTHFFASDIGPLESKSPRKLPAIVIPFAPVLKSIAFKPKSRMTMPRMTLLSALSPMSNPLPLRLLPSTMTGRKLPATHPDCVVPSMVTRSVIVLSAEEGK